MINITIIDDNQAQLNYLEKELLSLTSHHISIQKFQDENTFINNLHNVSEYSIFFVDIVLNNKTGIDIAKQINKNIRGAIIIFMSSHLDKVVDIYDANHYYFIYKPELEKRLPIALNKAIESLEELKKTLPITLKKGSLLIHPADVLYLERRSHKTYIYENDQERMTNDKLDDFTHKLPAYFIRCHRSFILNMQYVKEMGRNECVLNNGTIIPISRAYQKKIKTHFQEFLMSNI